MCSYCASVARCPGTCQSSRSLAVARRITIIINLLKSQGYLAKHKCSTPEKKTGAPGEKPLEGESLEKQQRWRRVRELIPGHNGGRRMLSPPRQPCSLVNTSLGTRILNACTNAHVQTSLCSSKSPLYFGLYLCHLCKRGVTLIKGKMCDSLEILGCMRGNKSHLTIGY